MAPWPVFIVIGVVLGALSGVFGVGGSSLATPLLSVLGVPGIVAVASPLPATWPIALAAAWPYVRMRNFRPKAAAWSLLGATPAAVVGALLSRVIGGAPLLVASGIVLIVIGLRVVHPIGAETQRAGEARRKNRPTLVLASCAVGLFTGLLANGGGFLLVPMYLLLFGLSMQEASGTSLLLISALALPTTLTHWALGHINWSVAGALALGAVPTSAISALYAQRLSATRLQRAFGWFLVACGAIFTITRITAS